MRKSMVCAVMLAMCATGVGGAESFKEQITFFTGDSGWFDGSAIREGKDWLALVCTGQSCSFEEAAVSVKQEEGWAMYYSGPPGERVSARRLGGGAKGSIVAWFRHSQGSRWLTAGKVVTYAFRGYGLERPATKGTYDIAVAQPNGTKAILTPVVLDLNASWYGSPPPEIGLYLRADGMTTVLGPMALCTGVLSRDYLLWAGDMDGDGRTDYLVDSNVEAGIGSVTLYLSGAAKAGELIGVGGTYVKRGPDEHLCT